VSRLTEAAQPSQSKGLWQPEAALRDFQLSLEKRRFSPVWKQVRGPDMGARRCAAGNRPYVGVRNMLFTTLLSQKTMGNNALIFDFRL
jgi:hypothetical protein